jgi:hypothetical protein
VWCVEIRRDATAKRNVIIQFSLVIVRTYRGTMVPCGTTWYHSNVVHITFFPFVSFSLPEKHTHFFSLVEVELFFLIFQKERSLKTNTSIGNSHPQNCTIRQRARIDVCLLATTA